MIFTKAHAAELSWYFLHADADTSGVRSSAGGAMDRARDGTPRASLQAREPTEERREAVQRARVLAKALDEIGDEHRRVLGLRYGGKQGAWPGLEAWGPLGGIVLYAIEHTSEDLCGKDGAPMKDLGLPSAGELDREKAELNALVTSKRAVDRKTRDALKLRAQTMLTDSQSAYASARGAVERKSEGPVYTVSVTIREAARILQIGETTVKAMLADGRLAFRMVGAHGQHRRVVLTSPKPFPPGIGAETRGRKKMLTAAPKEK